MDIELGEGMDGGLAARTIQQFRDVPVVFLTAHTEQEIVEKIRSVTGYGYVLKGAGENVPVSIVEMALRLQSVGIEQTEFYRTVVAVKKQDGLPENWVMEAIRLIIDNEVDRYTLPTELMYTVLELLNTAPLKEQAVEQCDRLRRERMGDAKKGGL